MLRRSMTPRPAKCAHCKTRLERVGQRIHEACVGPWYEANRDKLRAKAEVQARRKVEAAKKQERAQDRAKRASFERIPDLIAAADKEFASYIRERDRQAGYACISSGRPLDWTGNQVDAGHYRSRGAASHLRYNEGNCHAQSKHDNRHLSGNIVQYRINLIARIGLARVEALEADNTPHKWQRDELIAIRDKYRAKTKELKAKQ